MRGTWTWIIFLSCWLSIYSKVQGQFYVSPKVCLAPTSSIAPPLTPPVPGSPPAANRDPAVCQTPAYFFDTDTTSFTREWDVLGDGNFQEGPRAITFSYSQEGTFSVTLRKTNRLGITTIENQPVVVGRAPSRPLFNREPTTDTTICKGSTLTLNPYRHQAGIAPSGVTYKWFPGGQTTPTIDVDSAGCYSVEVSDAITGCSQTARINVKFCLAPPAAGGGAERWYFGQGATLEFLQGGDIISAVRDSLANEGTIFQIGEETIDNPSFSPAAQASTIPNRVRTDGATSMVFGPTGQLVFYSDGKAIYSARDSALSVATTEEIRLGGATNTVSGIAILPKFGCHACKFHEYWAVYLDAATQILSYDVIDMRVQSEFGKITQKGIPLLYPATGAIRVVAKPDDTGYILVAQQQNSKLLHTFVIDSTGINRIVSDLGGLPTERFDASALTISSANGETWAMISREDDTWELELLTLNRDNYQLAIDRSITLPIRAGGAVTGLSFSPNESQIFFTVNYPLGSTPLSEIYQVSMNDTNPPRLVVSSDTESYQGIQVGPVAGEGAKYLYVAVSGSLSLPYFQSSNDVGNNAEEVGWVRTTDPNAAVLNKPSGAYFPQVVRAPQENEGDGIQANYSGNCQDSPTILSTEDICSPQRNEVEWIFEDGTIEKGKQISKIFPKIGWNRFQMRIRTFNKSPLSGVINNQLINSIIQQLETLCTDTTVVDSIYIKPRPMFSLPDSFYVCLKTDPIVPTRIDPRPTGGKEFEYRWMTTLGATFSTNSFFDFRIPQTFDLEVTNDLGCVTTQRSKAVSGCLPVILAPDIFTPNGDGINDIFEPIVRFTSQYQLIIYNRWGELIFEANQPEQARWDGMVRGRILAPALYTYQIRYIAEDFPEQGVQVKQGSVLVVR